ncbi:unnamed protein product [Sympodiomycopsis kandeliae]
MPPSARPTTPIRRISRGSLSALSHSRGPEGGEEDNHHLSVDHSNHASSSTLSAPTSLSFLDESIGYLSDETSTLLTNLKDLSEIHSALNTFNEGFSMYLYGLKVAAYCIEWQDSPQVESFSRYQQYKNNARGRRRKSSVGMGNRTSGIPVPIGSDMSNMRSSSPHVDATAATGAADQTYVTQDDEQSFLARPARGRGASTAVRGGRGRGGTTSTRGRAVSGTGTGTSANSAPALKSAMRKPSTTTGATSASKSTTTSPAAAKPKITLAQKKKREKYAGEVVETLPLEYRGTDPAARRVAESVVMALIAAGSKGAKMADIVKPPELAQVKVNKCLIALTNAKHVVKGSNNGIVYLLDPNRHPQLPP